MEPEIEKLLSEALEFKFPQSPLPLAAQSLNTSPEVIQSNSTPKVLLGERQNDESSSVSYFPLQFANAAEFLMFFDPSLRTGKKKLYKWQIEELIRLSDKSLYRISAPLEYLLLAANGSGKDAFIIAGFVCFVLCCWRRYKIVITSSSDLQLDSQTRNYITYLSKSVNFYLKEIGIPASIDVKKETFKSSVVEDASGKYISLTGSEVITFVTKEGGRAEGHHPFPDADPGEGVILIVNEAKTVQQEIYDHFAKCTYNMFIQVSSAGAARGNFYNACKNAVEFPRPYQEGQYYLRRITAYDCPAHIPPSKLKKELEEYGENDPWFKNTRLSQFSSIGEAVVITEEVLSKCLLKKVERIKAGIKRRAGLDLAGGGDENSLTVVEDNEIIAQEFWRAKDTELTVDHLVGTSDGGMGLFQKYNLQGQDIFADDGGLGQPMLDGLARRGYTVNRILNQSAAINTQRYLNRGAEMWFIFARMVAAGLIKFSIEMTAKLQHQLCNRHYAQDERLGKIKLWSKAEERLEGNESPDRADSVILAFTGISIFDFTEGRKSPPPTTPGSILSTKEILQANPSKYREWQRADIYPSPAKKVNNNNPLNVLRALYGNN